MGDRHSSRYDPRAYSDDVRLDLRTEILLEAGERMQIIILTCRKRAFRHVPANRNVMDALVTPTGLEPVFSP